MQAQIHTLSQKAATMPENVEAEQMLLGALLLDNGIMPRIAAALDADDMADPVHGRIYELARGMIDRGETASPVTLRGLLGDELKDLGGGQYLVRLAGAAAPHSAVGDYAHLIRDLANRRRALQLIRDTEAALIRGVEATGDVMGRLEAGVASLAPAASKMRPVSFLEASVNALRQMDDVFHGRATPGIRPPWVALSRIVPSFRPGDMVVIGGRPSMGKTAISLSLATAAAHAGHPVVIASLEMTPEDMAARALAERTSENGRAVPFVAMTNGTMTEDQYRSTIEAAQELQSLPITFLSEDFRKAGPLMAGVKSALRRMDTGSGKVPLVMVDYMQLMEGQGRDLREQVTDISKQMKHLARSCGAVNVALSQLSRAVESRQDKRPMLSDLRETGQVEQDADAVLFCFREEYYIEREPIPEKAEAMIERETRLERARNRLELIVAKHRRGPIGTAHLRFAPAMNRVWEDGV